jgi:hypothetical protein
MDGGPNHVQPTRPHPRTYPLIVGPIIGPKCLQDREGEALGAQWRRKQCVRAAIEHRARRWSQPPPPPPPQSYRPPPRHPKAARPPPAAARCGGRQPSYPPWDKHLQRRRWLHCCRDHLEATQGHMRLSRGHRQWATLGHPGRRRSLASGVADAVATDEPTRTAGGTPSMRRRCENSGGRCPPSPRGPRH